MFALMSNSIAMIMNSAAREFAICRQIAAKVVQKKNAEPSAQNAARSGARPNVARLSALLFLLRETLTAEIKIAVWEVV